MPRLICSYRAISALHVYAKDLRGKKFHSNFRASVTISLLLSEFKRYTTWGFCVATLILYILLYISFMELTRYRDLKMSKLNKK